jgi:LVIVD repeat-containing protein
MKHRLLVGVSALVAALLLVPAVASAHWIQSSSAFSTSLISPAAFNEITGANFDISKNLDPRGFSPRRETAFSQLNTDLAFWRDKAYQGSFSGFSIVDISRPSRPERILDYRDCAGPAGQGDIVAYGNLLVRSWDAPASSTARCDGQLIGAGWEGVHVFDVSNPADPRLVAQVRTRCGSHTASGFPDLRNNRLIVYNSPSYSPGNCPAGPPAEGFEVLEVPLGNPAAARTLRFEEAGDDIHCHDVGIILGDVMKAACAGGAGFAVWSLGGEDGGTLDDPRLLYTQHVPDIADVFNQPDPPTGHSAAFSNDGETIIFGHEPAGGLSPRCTRTGTPLNTTGTIVQTDEMKSFFFYDVESREQVGRWTLTRDQSVFENCTLHNYNIVPVRGRDILVHGSYQSGIGVLDFTNRSRPKEIAFADPAPLNPNAFSIGGDWSTYWYNGRIYESDITRGLMVWDLRSSAVAGARKFDFLNPQTQVFTTDDDSDSDSD